MSNSDVIQAQLDAYNTQDVDAFMRSYAPNAVLAVLNGDILAEGADAIRARHVNLFATHPQNKATLVNRIVVAESHIIDHEDVERAPGGERFQVAAIYTLKNGLIARVDFAR